jgi:undecaprenyl-diphosphatase
VTTVQAVFLGALQGLAEFLPISSSAHLSLAPWAIGWPAPGLPFDVAMHVGTLVAVLWYFRREWLTLASAVLRALRRRRVETAEERRAIFLVAATLPGALAGLLLEEQASGVFRAPPLTAAALMAMGVVLWVADVRARRDRALGAMRWRDALLIGCAQAFAIVPGVSRAGATITAARLLGYDRTSAATFSFLMSMPIIAAAATLEFPRAVAGGFSLPLALAMVTAGVFGWLAIAVLLRFLRLHGFGVFALYRLALGTAVLVLFAARGGG